MCKSILKGIMKGTSHPLVWLVSLVLLSSSCATLSNRDKVLISTATGIVVGGTIGYLTTPNDGTSSAGHAALWAGVGGLATGTTGLFVFDEQKRSAQMEHEISQFKLCWVNMTSMQESRCQSILNLL
jgi:hypothetical protein